MAVIAHRSVRASGVNAGGARRVHLDSLVAAVTALGIGAHLPLPGPLTLTLVLSVALLPVWLPHLARHQSGVVALTGLGAILNGLLLNSVNASTHHISVPLTEAQIVLILELLLGSGALVWVRSVVGSGWMGLLFGSGMLLSVLPRLSADNPWKFSLSLPVTICLLAAAWLVKARTGELVALVLLALVSALNDSRSAASILATAFLILSWQRARAALQLRSTALRVGVSIVLLGLMTYFVMQSFILQGFLGEGAQLRSEAQIRSSGSLLLGGRPEIGATLALLRASPGGYGLGVVPNFADIYTAKSGMERLNYDANNGYVERYMFGGAFEVHSVMGDLWLRCGPMGLAFLLAMLVLVLRNSAARLAEGRGRALTTFLAIQVVWDAFFSPFYTTAALALTVAVGLLVRLPTRARDDAAGVPE